MSDSPIAIRAIALAEAVKYYAKDSSAGLAAIVAAAEEFTVFLNNTGAAKPAPVAKAEKPVKAVAKPAKVEPVPEPAEEPAEEPEIVEGPTKVDVGNAVEKLLGANKRAEAVALMKKFGAASVSTLAEDKYAAFIEAADLILMAT